MRKVVGLIVSMSYVLWLATPAAQAAPDFVTALQGIQSSVRASARGLGLGAFSPTEVIPPVHNPQQEEADRIRSQIAQNGIRATVAVRAGDSLGSGFIIRTSGVVMTNKHVVAGDPTHLTVETSEGQVYPARLLAAAPGRDIALLQIMPRQGERPVTDWPALTFGSSEELRPGHTVYAIGNPGGLRHSFSEGRVSRPVQEQTSYWVDHIQSDIRIIPGNSGGPLLNSRGQVVGMNTAITSVGGFAFSIRSEDLQGALSQYRRDGRLVDGRFGGSLMALESGSPFVGSVSDAASRTAGLRVGDTILTIDGIPLGESGAGQVMRAFGHKRPGEKVELRVRRAQAATLVIPAAEEGQAERTAGAFVVNEEGFVYVPAGSLEVLRAAATSGAEPKIRVGGHDYAASMVTIGRGGFGILRINSDAGWTAPEAQEEDVRVPVAPYTFSAAPAVS